MMIGSQMPPMSMLKTRGAAAHDDFDVFKARFEFVRQ